MKIKILATLLSVGSLFMASCVDEEPVDREKPVIDQFTLSKSQAWVDSFTIINASFYDNEGLAEVRIDIHQNFDLHAHQKVNPYFEWERIIKLDVNPVDFLYSDTIVIPADVKAGPYHVEAVALDMNGNQSDPRIIKLIINSPDQPQLNLIKPFPDVDLKVNKGDNIPIQGTITDETDLIEIGIFLEASSGHETPLFEKDIDLDNNNDTLFQVNELIAIPSGAPSGDHRLIIMARDNDGNLSVQENHVEIR